MKKIVLKPYTNELKGVWDEVVIRSKSGNFMHLRDYMDYHANRFVERSVIALLKERPVAVFPCNLQDDMIISHDGLTYGGLLYGTDLHATDVLEVFDTLFQHYKALGVRALRYKAIPHIFHRYPAEEDLYALFRHEARLTRRDLSSAVSMDRRIKFSDSRKSTINKAKRNGVDFVKGGDLMEFHRLLERVLIKFGSKPVHTLAELELLQNRFPEKIHLFTALKKRNLLAGALVYDFGHAVHTQYLANSSEGREIGALDFLIANLLEKEFVDKKYFSFGISTEEDGRFLNKGLAFQKEGFGARAVVHDFYEMEIK